MSDEKMREEFERSYAPMFPCTFERRNSDNDYVWERVQVAWEGWQASAAHSAARIAELEKAAQDEIDRLDAQKMELEGQVAMLHDVLNHPKLFTSTAAYNQLVEAISATAQTAEQYKRRVQAEALEEAAINHETWHGFDKHGTSEFLRYIASELRNPAAQAEGKGEK